jgi:ferric iron reductase protein FhuF
MTLPELDPLFAGPLEAYRGRLVPLEDPRPSIAGSDLLRPEVLGDRLARFARTYARPEPRAVASIWLKHHLAALLPVTVAAAVLMGRTLPVALEAVEVVEDAEGRTVALKLSDAGTSFAGNLESLVDGHLAPLIAAVSAASGLAPRVAWSNAGNVLDLLVRQLGELPLADRGPHDAAADLMRGRRLPNGRPNPLHEPVRLVPGPDGPRRQRRVCCLRYLIPSLSLCAGCPLPARPA